MRRILLLVIAAPSIARADVDVTLGVGVAASTLGDWSRAGQSLRGRAAYRLSTWLDAGVDAHVVRGQGVLGATLRAAVGRVYVRGGVGVNTGWHGDMTHDALTPVVLAAIGGDVKQARDYTVAVELSGFGGGGAADAVFPDERVAISLDANVRF